MPKQSEKDFLAILEKKAKEDKKILATEVMPKWARKFGEWLAVHPWRVLVPLSVLAYGLLRTAYGGRFRELILSLFGGF